MTETEARLETLEAHVAGLEAIIDVLLQEAENGTLEQAAASIRAASSMRCFKVPFAKTAAS